MLGNEYYPPLDSLCAVCLQEAGDDCFLHEGTKKKVCMVCAKELPASAARIAMAKNQPNIGKAS